MDFAFRYGNTVGLLDFGLSAFVGTSREPSFLLGEPTGPVPTIATHLVPYYEQIRQVGVDAQLTTEALLYKMEVIRRGGASNLLGRKQDYSAFIVGMERTLYALFDSAADLTFLVEWHYDDRNRLATSAWANDLFIAGFLTLNDVQGTEFVAGLLGDIRHDSRALSLEMKRRLTASWSLRLEAIVNLSVDPQDLTYGGRRDSFLGVELSFSF